MRKGGKAALPQRTHSSTVPYATQVQNNATGLRVKLQNRVKVFLIFSQCEHMSILVSQLEDMYTMRRYNLCITQYEGIHLHRLHYGTGSQRTLLKGKKMYLDANDLCR